MSRLYVGAVSPIALQFVIEAGDSGVDLTTVTSATFWVQCPSGTEIAWSGTLSDVSASSLTVSYAFQSGDLCEKGTWKVFVELALSSGGPVRTETVEQHVLSRYGT